MNQRTSEYRPKTDMHSNHHSQHADPRRVSLGLIALFAAGLVLGLVLPAGAVGVWVARSIEDMAQNADLVVKATAISTAQVDGSVPGNGPDFTHSETKLRVISILKGKTDGEIITFLHSDVHTNQVGLSQDIENIGRAAAMADMGIFTSHYDFIPGRSYIVFARSRDRRPGGSIFQALSFGLMEGVDFGVVLSADDQPVTAKSVKDACWQDLVDCCASSNVADVVYGLDRLDQASGGGTKARRSNFFLRQDVVDILRPLLTNQSAGISPAAFEVAGSQGPYTGDFLNEASSWMASPKGRAPGWSPDEKFTNQTGRLLWQDLATIVDGHAPAETRALAIRTLGRTDVLELAPMAEHWAVDSQPLVRQAAMLFLADYPGELSQGIIQAAVRDPAPEVREAAALAAGFAKLGAFVPQLGDLLNDASPDVREAAAISLLSLPLADTGEVLRQHKSDTNYGCLFVCALAKSDPVPYLDDLKKIIIKDPIPAHWWGQSGSVSSREMNPARDSWYALFNGYVRSRPVEELKNGKLDPMLDILEELNRHSISEPAILKYFYTESGLTVRALADRQATRPLFSTTNTFWSGHFAM